MFEDKTTFISNTASDIRQKGTAIFESEGDISNLKINKLEKRKTQRRRSSQFQKSSFKGIRENLKDLQLSSSEGEDEDEEDEEISQISFYRYPEQVKDASSQEKDNDQIDTPLNQRHHHQQKTIITQSSLIRNPSIRRQSLLQLENKNNKKQKEYKSSIIKSCVNKFSSLSSLHLLKNIKPSYFQMLGDKAFYLENNLIQTSSRKKVGFLDKVKAKLKLICSIKKDQKKSSLDSEMEIKNISSQSTSLNKSQSLRSRSNGNQLKVQEYNCKSFCDPLLRGKYFIFNGSALLQLLELISLVVGSDPECFPQQLRKIFEVIIFIPFLFYIPFSVSFGIDLPLILAIIIIIVTIWGISSRLVSSFYQEDVYITDLSASVLRYAKRMMFADFLVLLSLTATNNKYFLFSAFLKAPAVFTSTKSLFFHFQSVRKYPRIGGVALLILFMLLQIQISACAFHAVGMATAYSENNWLYNMGLDKADWHERYFCSIYFSFTTMMNVIYGDIHAFNNAERLCSMMISVFSFAFFTYFIATVGILMQEVVQRTEQLNSTRQTILEFMIKRSMPQRLQVRMMHIIQHALPLFNQEEEDSKKQLLENLPARLKTILFNDRYYNILASSKVFSSIFSQSCLKILAERMKEQDLSHDETLLSQNETTKSIFFLIKGQLQLIFPNNNSMPLILSATGNPQELILSYFIWLGKEIGVKQALLGTSMNYQIKSFKQKEQVIIASLDVTDLWQVVGKSSKDYESLCSLRDGFQFEESTLGLECQLCSQAHEIQDCFYLKVAISPMRVKGMVSHDFISERKKIERKRDPSWDPRNKISEIKGKLKKYRLFLTRASLRERQLLLSDESLLLLSDEEFFDKVPAIKVVSCDINNYEFAIEDESLLDDYQKLRRTKFKRELELEEDNFDLLDQINNNDNAGDINLNFEGNQKDFNFFEFAGLPPQAQGDKLTENIFTRIKQFSAPEMEDKSANNKLIFPPLKAPLAFQEQEGNSNENDQEKKIDWIQQTSLNQQSLFKIPNELKKNVSQKINNLTDDKDSKYQKQIPLKKQSIKFSLLYPSFGRFQFKKNRQPTSRFLNGQRFLLTKKKSEKQINFGITRKLVKEKLRQRRLREIKGMLDSQKLYDKNENIQNSQTLKNSCGGGGGGGIKNVSDITKSVMNSPLYRQCESISERSMVQSMIEITDSLEFDQLKNYSRYRPSYNAKLVLKRYAAIQQNTNQNIFLPLKSDRRRNIMMERWHILTKTQSAIQ